ncbi:hypothetical protein [Carboxylicivirga marina]|uniref:Uncharacterized protein n=1 Tax=Carboxylicivirga marina TaxID=2800988 RepID=A0ABS1HGK8_9BACT|nr:hypothetical protein [Carboxylicivirga marina]MBK3516334.1 hypothetical protein [Carboxylicivirga marina]
MMFAIQTASNALFYHTHNIDGKSYSHAHPGCDGHSHAPTDFAFYQQLQTSVSKEAPALLSDILLVYHERSAVECTFLYNQRHISQCTGRAPPVA